MNTYTISDCLKLRQILLCLGDPEKSISFYEMVIDKTRKVMLDQSVDGRQIETYLRDWTVSNYTFGMRSKIHKFMFYISFEEVPLFINDNDINIFVKWRLEISK